MSFDLASFYNDYSNLLAGSSHPPSFVATPAPHLEVASFPINGISGRSFGFEATVEWLASDWWRFAAAYSFVKLDQDFSAITSIFDSGKDPRNQTSLRSSMNLPADLQFDMWGRYVDELPTFGIEAYFDLDARLSWRPYEDFEVAIVGQNLVEPARFEFAPQPWAQTIGTAVQRGIYMEASLRF